MEFESEMMETKLQRLATLLHEVVDLRFAQALLGWDQQTNMPRGGAVDRSNQLATLASIEHEKFTSEEMGKLLEDLLPYAGQLDPESTEARLIWHTHKEYQKSTRVTQEWVTGFTRAAAMAQSAWEQAREASDFSIFRPHLEGLVELRRQYAAFFAPYEHIYDPLLDISERGIKTSEVQAIFSWLRPRQVELIQAISERPQVDNSFFNQVYPEQAQWDFGVAAVTRLGFDWNRGRQDRSAHPFTSNFGIGDVRITTRFDERAPASALFSTIHEGGHALYEQGVDPALARTPLATGASMALHESQSRMYENMVGRSLPFWRFFYPRLQQHFPSQLGNVSLQAFYRGINKVEPSLIRVEADEATYNLHIMLRMELEIALLDGSLPVSELPGAWNARMQEYLGLTPPNDALGVLQDVHWSGGMIGYFPAYALGNLVAAQLWDAMLLDLPDLYEQIERGEFGGLLAWLREKVHRHGARYEPQELVQKITGSRIDPQPYLAYLQSKYGQIYAL